MTAERKRYCAGCSELIEDGQPVIPIPLAGEREGITAYRHADDADCSAALARSDPGIHYRVLPPPLPPRSWR
jgi:hypothetical protein